MNIYREDARKPVYSEFSQSNIKSNACYFQSWPFRVRKSQLLEKTFAFAMIINAIFFS